ncbi:MAG TPA: PilC/PilY family type IV pilus protein [Casimicrobiaceae bacterium]|nr:PilC/PilY family type IV pilus protein [Casimicrobiaceae bacterium]
MKPEHLKRKWPLLLAAAFALVLPLSTVAEDIDIFVGGAGGGSAANVLVVIDNTSNWADNAQHWPGGEVQGQAELEALIAIIPTLKDSVNVGLMMFNQNGSGNCCSGGYIRYAMQPMNATNRAALLAELNNILTNFSSPSNKAASNASYSMALFDAFKYFGGYTSPAHATDDVAGTPQNATQFGPAVFATPASTFNRPDPLGYANGTYTVYRPPAAAADVCGGKNYIIFIGNGFPNTDTPPSENMKTFLEGVGGNSTQIWMPVLTATTSTAFTNLGYSSACYNNDNSGLSSCSTANAGTCGSSYDTCSCGTPTTTTGCSSGKVKYSVLGGVTTTAVTPTGTTALPAANKTRYADEWTRFLYLTDVNAAAGQQNVTTFTIDAFNAKQNPDQTSLLYSMANSGGGQYYAAKNKNDLIFDLGDIFTKIQATNSTFASASLPLSATNRAVNANEVYIGMFRPDASAKPLWYGNMKRYKIGNFGGNFNLADKWGAQAVNPLTGFLDDCATSWWTSDSGKYWWGVTSNPPPNGACPASPKNTFDPYSDAPDGPKVEKGSVAEIIRQGNNPTSAPTWALNRTLYTKGFLTFNATNVTSAEMAPADVDFIRGLNVDPTGNHLTYQHDPADPTKTTTIRPTVHGDVVHSRPMAINYGSQTVIYYGANDGTLRAADSATGKELWAYVAPEFYATLPRLRQDSPLISYSFLNPLSISPPRMPKNYYFDGSIGVYQNSDSSKVWVYPTMRRGGRMIYALDVTTPSAPTLKWKVGCPSLTNNTGCTSNDFTPIGQTWSTPNVGTLKIGGTAGETPTPIIAVGGGYDNCEDGSPSAACGAKGSIVYILNAADGAKLASFTTAGRVVADVVFVDMDGDGIPDFAYAADTRGNIYRISFGFSKSAPLAAASWTSTLIAATTGSNRKFLYAPAVSPAYDSSTGKFYVYLALGTGDREQPLETQYPYTNRVLNRFYVYIDDITSTAKADLDNSTAMSDFTATTSCATSLVIPGSGKAGWFMDLNAYGPGEQTVTSAVIVGGFVAFSTNRAIPRSANVCAPLGEARGYAVNLLNATGVIGVQPNTCGGDRSGTFAGGGLPPSPVVTNVDVDGKVVTIGIGVINLSGGASSGIQSQQVFSLPPQPRRRVYWRQEGDN